MYNADQKHRFMNYCRTIKEESTVELIEKIFNSTEKEEIQFDKDVSEFNHIEVVDLLKSLNSKSPRRLKTWCSFLSEYYLWCYNVEKLVDSIVNPFDNRITDGIINDIIPKDMLNKKYFSKQEYIDLVENNVADVSNQCIAYSIYCGIKGDGFKELTHMRIADLDFENNILTLVTGRKVKIDSLLKRLLIQTNDEKVYFPDGVEKEYLFGKNEYVESEYIIKKCGGKKEESKPVRTEYINARFLTIKEQMENEFISASAIYKNGLINYIKEQYEKRGITLHDAFLKKIDGLKYVYEEETKKYIEEFGSKMTVRALRLEIKDYLDQF